MTSENESAKFVNNTPAFGESVICCGGYDDFKIDEDATLKAYIKHLKSCILQLKLYRERVEYFPPEGTEKIINWPLIRYKLNTIEKWIKSSWKIIVFVLFLLGLIASAINDWETLSTFINSSNV